MNCEQVREFWAVYYDSEGGPELYSQVNSHLSECEECTRWFQRQSQLEKFFERKLTIDRSTPSLWKAVLSQNTFADNTRTSRRFSRKVSLALALVAMVTAVWLIARPSQDANLPEIAAEYHSRFAAGEEPLEYVSDQDLEIEKYLRRRVSFPVRCPPRRDSGFLVEGGGVRRINTGEMAYLVGRLDDSNVSIFILPQKARKLLPRKVGPGIQSFHQGSWRVLVTEFDRNIVLIVGETSTERLAHVLHAYGSYPRSHSG